MKLDPSLPTIIEKTITAVVAEGHQPPAESVFIDLEDELLDLESKIINLPVSIPAA